LRARIDGAVMRLPGTGDGVARLVEVSMVKVDIARLLAARSDDSQSRGKVGSSTIGNFNGLLFFNLASALVRTCVKMSWSIPMIDRHWFGDVSLAILLALPLAALAQPLASIRNPAPAAVHLSTSGAVPSAGRISLLG